MAHKTSLSPGVVEIDKSTLHDTKEDLRINQLIPEDILTDKTRLSNFLNAYYAFMNMDEFIYQETETFNDIVLDGLARFRIPDPDNENDKFFTDETGASSTLILTSPTGIAPAEFTFDASSNEIVDVGKVDEITMTNTGSGYTTATVTFSAPPGNGITATGTAVITDESITSITITNPGNGYTSPPSITITGDGNSAQAEAIIASNNRLKLSNFQINALPIGTLIQYSQGDGTPIGGLTNNNLYYVVSQTNDAVQLSNSLGGTAITLTAPGTGTLHKFRGTAPTMEIPLDSVNVAVTNGNELPGTLAQSTSEIGKTFTVNGLSSFNNYTAKLTTISKYWVGPGPSWVMNNIETAMDIDKNELNYLELMQREIAAAVPRDVTVNKRNLYKRIIDFYKLRGSSDSIEIFFRLLFNDSVTVEFPFDKTLVPSSGKWDQPEDISAILSSAVNNTSTLILKEENNAIGLSSKLVVDSIYNKVDDIRVTGNTPVIDGNGNITGTQITISRPAPTLFDASETSIIDTTNNSIKLSSDEIIKYPVGTKLTYRIPTGGTVITGLTDGDDYFVVAIAGNSIKLSTTENGSVINLTGLGGEAEHELIRYIKLDADTNLKFVPRGTYLDHKGFVSYDIKLHDSLRYQRFSYLIKTGKNLSDWEYTYDKLVHPAGFVYFAEILIFLELVDDTLTAELNRASMPFKQPGVIGPEDIPLLVQMFASQFLPNTNAKIHKSATLSLSLKNGEITGFNITDGGSGYTAAPTISTADANDVLFTPANLTTAITNGSLTGITIVDGGKGYNSPTGLVSAPTRIVFDGSSFGFGNIVHNDTITLTAAQVSSLQTGDIVTYDSGGLLSVGGLTNGDSYTILDTPSSTTIRLEDPNNPGSSITFGNAGGGTNHGFTGETATVTFTKTDGRLESISVVEPGFGYTSTPAITFAGVEQSPGSGTAPVASIALDSLGRLDRDNITITSEGSGWSSLFGTVAANPNNGTVATVSTVGLADKTYKRTPKIVFSEPTAVDSSGELLPTNVTASAKFLLESTSISHIELTAQGNNYTAAPRLFFDQPFYTYTASPIFTEGFENATVASNFDYNTWNIHANDGGNNNGTHTASIETTEVDTGAKSLKIQTSALDTVPIGTIGGVGYQLQLGNPEYTERLVNNTVRVKCRAKADSSNGATFFEMGYSTSQYGNSGWQRNNLTTDWADYEFEYDISTTIPTNDDYVAFQGDGNDGIVYIDNVSIEMKYDYPRAITEIDNGKVISIRLLHSGSGYRENPTITFNTSGGAGAGAQAFAYLTSSEINGVSIINPGNGYAFDPTIRLGIAVQNEQRVAETPEVLDIQCNHNNVKPIIGTTINPKQSSGSLRGYTLYDNQRFDTAIDSLDASSNPDLTITEQTPVADKIVAEHRVRTKNPNFRTIINNGYIQRKGTENFFTSSRLYNTNQTIEFLGNNTLETIDSTVINKYNTSANVHIE